MLVNLVKRPVSLRNRPFREPKEKTTSVLITYGLSVCLCSHVQLEES